jgi:hypothetical protein
MPAVSAANKRSLYDVLFPCMADFGRWWKLAWGDLLLLAAEQRCDAGLCQAGQIPFCSTCTF